MFTQALEGTILSIRDQEPTLQGLLAATYNNPHLPLVLLEGFLPRVAPLAWAFLSHFHCCVKKYAGQASRPDSLRGMGGDLHFSKSPLNLQT